MEGGKGRKIEKMGEGMKCLNSAVSIINEEECHQVTRRV